MKLILNIYGHGVVMHVKVRKRAKIRNQYNQAPHLTQDTNGTSQLDITKESQEVSPFPAGDHKPPTNRSFIRVSSVIVPFDRLHINDLFRPQP